MDKYQNKYRVPSARAQWWDYGWNGAYFITICTDNRDHFFGKIEAGIMLLSPIGVIADVLWHELKKSHANIELGDFVVMPNHVHGILILDKPNHESRTVLPDSETIQTTSLQGIDNRVMKNKRMSDISPKSGSVSAVMRSYKSAVTKHARRLGYNFAWQKRFFDRIIRNDRHYQNTSDYIVSNPQNWKKDEHYT